MALYSLLQSLRGKWHLLMQSE